MKNVKQELVDFLTSNNIKLEQILAADINFTRGGGLFSSEDDFNVKLKMEPSESERNSFFEKLDFDYSEDGWGFDESWYWNISGTIWLTSELWIERVKYFDHKEEEQKTRWEVFQKPEVPKELIK